MNNGVIIENILKVVNNNFNTLPRICTKALKWMLNSAIKEVSWSIVNTSS